MLKLAAWPGARQSENMRHITQPSTDDAGAGSLIELGLLGVLLWNSDVLAGLQGCVVQLVQLGDIGHDR